MKKALALALVLVGVLGLTELGAQQPLPITRVLLYKNGMAYIVRGGQLTTPLTLTFECSVCPPGVVVPPAIEVVPAIPAPPVAPMPVPVPIPPAKGAWVPARQPAGESPAEPKGSGLPIPALPPAVSKP